MRKITFFPSAESANEFGLVALGVEINVQTLMEAYKAGIFPWPLPEDMKMPKAPMAWFSPNPRGVLFIKDLHLSKSFKKFLNKNTYQITFNQHFHQVIEACSTVNRNGENSTWITSEIMNGYTDLFKQGLAYSVEIKNKDKIVGGIYGVQIGQFFSAESMFTLEDNAGKLALYELIQKISHKTPWIDTKW